MPGTVYRLVFADEKGRIFDHRFLRAAGRAGDRLVEISEGDLEVLPPGASLVLVPGGVPVGVGRAGRFTALEKDPWKGGRVFAVAALLPQGYARTLLPAYARPRGEGPLPLFGYTAVAWRGGTFYAAARKVEEPGTWDPAHYCTPDLPALVDKKLKACPQNRILKQLAKCALEYSCYTAQNIFYGRWEGGVPVSPACNAGCVGCISLQPSECCPSPQARIGFEPEVSEIVQVAVPHLEGGEGAIVSFGQGCEGEPATAFKTLVAAVCEIRKRTGRGTINMNTNGSIPAAVTELCRAGLDAVRVSLFSAREEYYRAYCRPRGFGLADVQNTLEAAAKAGAFTSLNLLVFPGFTDLEEEVRALIELIAACGVKMVQLRNLNIDPDLLWNSLPPIKGEALGIPSLISILKSVPGLEVGCYSRPKAG